jgi:hypothetical protein
MFNIVFYSPQNLMIEPKSRHVIDGIESTMLFAAMEVEQPWLIQWLKLKNIVFWQARRKILAMKDTISQLVLDRAALQKHQQVDNIFGDLLGHEAGKGGPDLSNVERMTDVSVMVIAGMHSNAHSYRSLGN